MGKKKKREQCARQRTVRNLERNQRFPVQCQCWIMDLFQAFPSFRYENFYLRIPKAWLCQSKCVLLGSFDFIFPKFALQICSPRNPSQTRSRTLAPCRVPLLLTDLLCMHTAQSGITWCGPAAGQLSLLRSHHSLLIIQMFFLVLFFCNADKELT